jgi:HPt (histidine-containing phosphotransfer) domain-containing protein
VFLQDYPKQMTELQEALGTGDAERTARMAHSLKGAVGCFGAQTAYTLAAQLETRGRHRDLHGASAVLRQLEQELARVSAFVAEPGWAARL